MIRIVFFLLSLFSFSFSSFASPQNLNENHTVPPAWNNIQHIVVITLENTYANDALVQPFMRSLTTRGAYLAQSYALTRPSQPNYIGFVAGSSLGVTNNNNVNLDATHIGNLLNAKGKTWKAYAEDLPSNCFLGTTSGNYARRHEPFISFRNVQTNPVECSKIVPGSVFFQDVANNTLPAFSYYVPNNLNNGHDTGVAYADNYLKNTFGPLFNNQTLMQNTLFIITFDEDDGNHDNRIYTLFIGAGVQPGALSNTRYTHYNILRTIEDIFALGTLGRNDSTSPAVLDIWADGPPTGQCLPPANIKSSWTTDRRSITLTWDKPANDTPVVDYQVNDWLDAIMWRGNALSFTDNTLPGRTGLFTYYLYTNCTTGQSARVQVDVNITDTPPPTKECLPPKNIRASWTPDRRSLTLFWDVPTNSAPIVTYQVNDYLNQIMWRGTDLSFTDNTIPGRTGKFTYFLYSNCESKTSEGVQFDVIITM